jgi:Zn-dependent protease with chaperone function
MGTETRRVLSNLRPEAFMHPSDATALTAVKQVWGLDTVVRKMNEYGFEKVYRLRHMAGNIRVTERTCPKYHRMVGECAKILDMPKLPDLFIEQTPMVNAYTTGVERPMIVLNSGLIDFLDDDEVFAVIAHEMGHIKCDHVLYHTVAQFLTVASGMIGLVGIAVSGINLVLLEWSRKSELSADRAALLSVQDPTIVTTVLMKLAGGSQKIASVIHYDDFIQQSKEYREMANSSALNKACKIFNTMFIDHPFPVMRATEIVEWAEGNEYRDILNGNRRSITIPKSGGSCPVCKTKITKGSKFCHSCGKEL